MRYERPGSGRSLSSETSWSCTDTIPASLTARTLASTVYSFTDTSIIFGLSRGRHAFIVRVSGRLAGFAMVRAIGAGESEPIHQIAEFFIMRKYRRQCIGTTVARRILDMFPGRWRVAEEEANTPAQAFWRQVISRYTRGKFREIRDDEWAGPVQEFKTESKEPKQEAKRSGLRRSAFSETAIRFWYTSDTTLRRESGSTVPLGAGSTLGNSAGRRWCGKSGKS